MNQLNLLLFAQDQRLIQRITKDISSFGYRNILIAENEITASQYLKKDAIDLLIIDIYPEREPISILNTANKLHNIGAIPIIFLSEIYNERIKTTIQKINPANCLIKPYQVRQLEVAIDLAISNYHQKRLITLSAPTPSSSLVLSSIDDCFFVKDKQQYIRIIFRDILWLEASNSCVEIITEQDRIVSYAGIKGFMEQFQNQYLVKVHRSYAVNLLKVIAYDESHLYVIHQDTQKSIPVAQGNRKSIFGRFRSLKTN